MEKDFFKFLHKGLAYHAQNGGQLQTLKFSKIVGLNFSRDLMGLVLKPLQHLVCLHMRDNKIGIEDARAVRFLLQSSKTLKEVDLTNSGLNLEMSKEIADGIIQAKRIEVFKVADNPEIPPEGVQ